MVLRVVGKRALFRINGAIFGVLDTKNLGHYFEVELFEVALFRVLLYVDFSNTQMAPASVGVTHVQIFRLQCNVLEAKFKNIF